jgi:hypothetical protein
VVRGGFAGTTSTFVDNLAGKSLFFQPPPGWLIFGGAVPILLGILIWRQFPLSGVWAAVGRVRTRQRPPWFDASTFLTNEQEEPLSAYRPSIRPAVRAPGACVNVGTDPVFVSNYKLSMSPV